MVGCDGDRSFGLVICVEEAGDVDGAGFGGGVYGVSGGEFFCVGALCDKEKF